MSIKAWNLMGGFNAEWLEVAAEIVGIRDMEGLVLDLATIRDWYKRSSD